MSTPSQSDSPTVSDQHRWFSDQVHPHDTSLRAYVRGSFPTVRDVDDVVQESYLRVWKARQSRKIECARGFLFRVARNVALNLLRHSRISPIEAVDDLSSLPVADELPLVTAISELRDDLALLAQAIDKLPPRCREIVIMRRIQHVSQKEIASRLGISVETVEQQVARGVRRCGDYLRKHAERNHHET